MIEITCTEAEKGFLTDAIFRNIISDECVLRQEYDEDECLRHRTCRDCIEDNVRWTVR